MKVEILYEDEVMVVVNKPPGLLTIPDRHDPTIPSLLHGLGQLQPDGLMTVHRLDRPTSGLLVFAKTAEAHRALSQQFEARSVDKIYLALVEGKPRLAAGLIEEPIAPHPTKAGKMMVSVKGKPAKTEYVVAQSFDQASLLEVQLHTGRTHQIRLHLAHIGHPLLVDPDYGHRADFFLSSLKGRRFKLKKNTEEQPILNRVPLHAYQLAFNHPLTAERCSFQAEPPKDIVALIRQLQKLS